MRVVEVVLLLMLLAAAPLLSVETLREAPVDNTVRNIEALRQAIAVLTRQVMLLIEVVEREDVSWEMKAQIKESLEMCKVILINLRTAAGE